MRVKNQSRTFLVALLFCTFLFYSVHARGPSTPEERARVIELIRMLEREPLSANAGPTRATLLQWAFDLPEMRFHRCSDLFGSALDNYPYRREFNDHLMLSGVAFTLECQDKGRDYVATYIAGVEESWIYYPRAKTNLVQTPNIENDHAPEIDRRREHRSL